MIAKELIKDFTESLFYDVSVLSEIADRDLKLAESRVEDCKKAVQTMIDGPLFVHPRLSIDLINSAALEIQADVHRNAALILRAQHLSGHLLEQDYDDLSGDLDVIHEKLKRLDRFGKSAFNYLSAAKQLYNI